MSVTVPLRTLVVFATGLAVALIAVLVFQAWRVDAAPGDSDTTFVPITPCRLFDTRPAPDRVGSAGGFGSDDTKTFVARGNNGDCNGIPTAAVGVSLNVTAVGASQATFLTIWPNGTRPKASNLNPAPGQPPTPNAVTTKLSGTGSFNVYNLAGTVNVIVDINGYYTKTSLQQLLAAQPFAISAHNATTLNLGSTPIAYVSLSVTAPVAGQVTLTSTAVVQNDTVDGIIVCAIYKTADIPPEFILTVEPSFQYFKSSGFQDQFSLSGTRTIDVGAGTTTSFSLACKKSSATAGGVWAGNLTAIFTPAA